MRRRNFIAGLASTTAVWPNAVRAQQPMPVIGFMSTRSPEDSVAVLAAFRRGLGEGGLIEGKNVEIQFGHGAISTGCPHWRPNSLISGPLTDIRDFGPHLKSRGAAESPKPRHQVLELRC
jgi:hypothetical protein